MSRLRIGVAGAGLIGRKHIEVLRAGGGEDYELAGVADIAPTAVEAGQALGYDVYPSLEAMLAHARPDGVVIALPNQLHLEAGLACLAAGAAILVEKPVADTVEAALELAAAGEATGLATLTGHHRRHNPIMRRAAALIADGAIGRPVAATSIWMLHKQEGYHDLAWRRAPGGGPVLINAIHEIDSLRMLLGDVETVQAADSNAVRGFVVEDTAAAILRFKSGVLGTLILSDTVSSPWAWETTSGENPAFPRTGQDSVFIGGTAGSLAIPSLDLRRHDDSGPDWRQPLTQTRAHITPADPYVEQMRHFAAIIRGKTKSVLPIRDGAVTLATTIAITQAAQTGAPVHVDTLLDG